MRHTHRKLLAVVLPVVLGFIAAVSVQTADHADAALPDIQAAVNTGVSNAAKYGVEQYVVILDRSTGQIVATSGGNIDTPVASESLVKLMIAAYYLRANGGSMPAAMNAEMWDMIVRSNNAPASKYWSNAIVSTIASAYGLSGTYNNPPRPGYWGATHVTARDMATLMWKIWTDPLVAPWLINAMRNAQPYDPSGSNQVFGFNDIDGDRGSKQGWGCDSYWRGPCSIGSVGWSDKIMGAVLQTGPEGAWGSMRTTSTFTTQQVVAAARKASPPTGVIDSVTSSGMAVRLRGWALDPGSPQVPIGVAIYRDGIGVGQYLTNVLRTDVNGAYGASGNHGFDLLLPAQPGGAHQYCAYAVGAQVQSSPLIGCWTVDVGVPLGNFEGVVVDGRDVSFTGWSVDVESPGDSLQVAVYRNGVGISWFSSTVDRPDVNAAFGSSGPRGFSISLAGEPPGVHEYCVYAIDPQGRVNSLLGCRAVGVQATAPIGVLEAVSASAGSVSLSGWMLDPDSPGASGSVAVYRDGVGISWFDVSVLRSDVNTVHGVVGAHGFDIELPDEPSGVHSYCVYAIDIQGVAVNSNVGCAAVDVIVNPPLGGFENAVVDGQDVALSGWAFDADSPGDSLQVAVYRDGVGISWFESMVDRPDVNAAFGGSGPHGFSISLVAEPPGVHEYCVYAIDPQGRVNPQLGCRTVAVQATEPMGVLDVVSTSAGSVSLTGWMLDPNSPETSGSVAVYRDGVGISWFDTAVPRSDVNGAFGVSGDHGFAVNLPNEPPGAHTYCVFAIDNEYVTTNPLLGCRAITV